MNDLNNQVELLLCVAWGLGTLDFSDRASDAFAELLALGYVTESGAVTERGMAYINARPNLFPLVF